MYCTYNFKLYISLSSLLSLPHSHTHIDTDTHNVLTHFPFFPQASKAEIAFLKYFGIVSPKAGRTLVYKMSDVAKMYQHWNLTIPDFIREICEGKVSYTLVYMYSTLRISCSGEIRIIVLQIDKHVLQLIKSPFWCLRSTVEVAGPPSAALH